MGSDPALGCSLQKDDCIHKMELLAGQIRPLVQTHFEVP